MSRQQAIKKLKAYKTDPSLYREPTFDELADLVLYVIGSLDIVDKAIKEGRLNGQTPVPDKDYLSKDTAVQFIQKEINSLKGYGTEQFTEVISKYDKQVQDALTRLRDGQDGKDAEVTEEHITRAAKLALELMELPDVENIVSTEIAANSEAIRNALELFDNEDDKLAITAIGGLVDKINELETRIIQSAAGRSGGMGKNTVLQLIAENGSSLPDQTGNNGKFLTTDGTDPAWATLAGGGDMAAATYDPTNVAGDAFDMANMAEGADAKILTAAERSAIAANSAKVSYTDAAKVADIEANADVTDTANVTAAGAEMTSRKNTNNGYAGLDAGGKINPTQLPALAISETFVVANQTAQLALTVQEGDIAVRTDQNKSYIALNDTNGSMSDWQELLTPTDAVQSVAGKTGTVTLDKADVGLSNVPNTDFTSAVAANTAKVSATATNIANAGALMDNEVTNLAQVKAFDSTDYATAAQGTTADSALQPNAAISVDEVTYDSPKAAVSAIGNSGSSQTLNALTHTIFTTSLTANCAFTFSNLTAGKSIELHMYGDGTQRTPTFPTAKLLYNDTTIAYPTTTGDLLVLTARHNGTEVVISAAGNYAAFS